MQIITSHMGWQSALRAGLMLAVVLLMASVAGA